MNIVYIEEIEVGDKVAVQDSETTVKVMTVKECFVSDGIIIFEESYPLDYEIGGEEIIVLDDNY